MSDNRIATVTRRFEVRPNEFGKAFHPLHQVVIPHVGLSIGEMWDLDALAADGRYDFWADAQSRRMADRSRQI